MVSGSNQHNNGANTQQGENLLSVYGRISPQTLLQSFPPKMHFVFLRRVLTKFFFFKELWESYQFPGVICRRRRRKKQQEIGINVKYLSRIGLRRESIIFP